MLTYLTDSERDIPVSYTHLDVYKRQLKRSTGEIESKLRKLGCPLYYEK